MAQLQFVYNYALGNSLGTTIPRQTQYFFPLLVPDNISLNTLGIFGNFSNVLGGIGSSWRWIFSCGVYSLTGSTLSMLNSGSGFYGAGNAGTFYQFGQISIWSATSNLTPGNWWFGFIFDTTKQTTATAADATLTLLGGFKAASNAFPSAFLGGAMTASTSSLVASINTSSLTSTNVGQLLCPSIIISA